MNYTLAALKKNDKKDWYVYFSYKNPNSGQLEPFKIRDGINRIKNLKERQTKGVEIASDINVKLKDGWSPFISQSINIVKLKPLLEVMSDLMEIKRGTLRARSIEHYLHAINVMRKYLTLYNLLEIYPKDFTNIQTQSFSDYLIVERKVSGRTHNNYISDMIIYFNMMVEREVIVMNPFTKIKKKPEQALRFLAYTDNQRKIVKDYLEENEPNLAMFVKCIYYCFIRPKELVELKIKHIDFESKQITIPTEIAKNRIQSGVVIPDAFFEEFKERYYNLPGEYFIFGKALIPCDINIRRNRVSEMHKKVIDALHLNKRHTLYSWKHTGASVAIKSGMDPYTLMRQLRHSSLEETMTYIKSLGLTPNTEFSLKQPKF